MRCQRVGCPEFIRGRFYTVSVKDRKSIGKEIEVRQEKWCEKCYMKYQPKGKKMTYHREKFITEVAEINKEGHEQSLEEEETDPDIETPRSKPKRRKRKPRGQESVAP